MVDNKYIQSLITWLNERTKEYNAGNPTVSDQSWDSVYFDLQNLEEQTGIIYPDSPTQAIPYEVKNELEKVQHNHPMLSLAKTKDWDEFLQYFTIGKDVIGMLKLDGLTCSLEYADGRLIRAETRGDGEIGENILHNARVIKNIPKIIDYKEHLVIDGEIICTDKGFEPFADEYANSRNFASGSIRLLDAKECAKRNLSFIAWNIVDGFNEENSFMRKLIAIEKLGFDITPWTSSFDWDAKDFLIDQAKKYGYPIDGLVGRYDDIEYGTKLGSTGHHSRAAYAFKFVDDTVDSILLDIEYDVSRRGILTPVARFVPVEIEGSIVEKATLSNLSVMEETLGKYPYVGQRVSVAKMNMIIPKILDADKLETPIEGNHYIEDVTICPICGGATEIREDGVARILYCTNPQCSAKLANQIEFYTSKKALDIKGISRKTIEKLIDKNWLSSTKDLYTLKEHRNDWVQMAGFGPASVDKILTAIEDSRNFNLQKFIVACQIPEIGTSASKELVKRYKTWNEFRNATAGELFSIDGFGAVMVDNILNFDYTEADEIYNKYMIITEPSPEEAEEFFEEARNMGRSAAAGKNFVITGVLSKSRASVVADIEAAGGSVKSSVSRNTDYLVNSDINSTTGKNKRAKELEIPIISEEELYKLINDKIIIIPTNNKPIKMVYEKEYLYSYTGKGYTIEKISPNNNIKLLFINKNGEFEWI